MRTMLRVLGLAAALTATGCGDSRDQDGSVPFKATDTSQFDEMKNQMIGNLKKKSSYTKVPTQTAPPAEKSQ